MVYVLCLHHKVLSRDVFLLLFSIFFSIIFFFFLYLENLFQEKKRKENFVYSDELNAWEFQNSRARFYCRC